MPPLAALGAAAAGAAAAVTLEGLAIGATIVGTGMKLVGMATGSKTMQKIGDDFSIAGGVGMAGSMLQGGKLGSVTGGASKTKGLLQTDNIDDILSAQTKGAKNISSMTINGPQSSSMDAFNRSSNSIGMDNKVSGNLGINNSAGALNLDLEKSFWQRANNTLTPYNPMLNIAGGMGDAYMINERMDLDRELLDKRLGFEQQLVDRVNTNNGTPININPSLNLNRNTGAYSGLLRQQ